ncbi:DNA alkylation repair protein [Mesorhizobium loti]|uniref:DNA alkylation repair protein n=1 Tax=Rhizobium loti TaxID=381 RepID=A0A6M7U5I0_RHILI|nr:DNA alkylation repair protein [Mesorhizobium loti]OBQ72769.1 DNA alkylation repair protein [Mesorhizobium loti]QKC71618.1 DNA alkylation repair protein [Mesorhizobium loti]
MAELSPQSSADEIVAHLRLVGSEENRLGMLRYGIRIERALGIPHGVQRQIARKIKRNHERAFELWESGIMEAQFIASVTADPNRFSAANARQWASSFDSWDIVDGVSDLFVDTDAWRELIDEFAADEREFVRRTAFAMMAWSVVHRKKEPEATFLTFLPIIEAHATDDRNFVKKAVNWALRSIGKRSMAMHGAALAVAERLAWSTDKTARWNGRNAVKELTDAKTLARIAARNV